MNLKIDPTLDVVIPAYIRLERDENPDEDLAWVDES